MKLLAATPLLSAAEAAPASRWDLAASSEAVKLYGDGLGLSSKEYVDVLARIVDERGIRQDDYSLGGVVEELEEKMAAALGKERAIFFPTGTLANHVAIRVLAGNRTRVIVPYDSHIYNDSGDCAQQLSQLNLVPLASETATFTVDQVREIVARTSTGRVTTGVGAVAIESPVRRRLGEMFDYDEMKRVCAWARENGIKTHLDGARLYMASGYTGIPPVEYASHFDTVYVSTWKYFNAPSGAILAGPAEVIDGLYHTRRMFGGGLPAAWPFAAVALHYFGTFQADFGAAVHAARRFFALLSEHGSFALEPMPNGSNLFWLAVKGTDPARFRDRLAAQNVLVSPPRGDRGRFLVVVNATWNRTDPETLAEKFRRSLS